MFRKKFIHIVRDEKFIDSAIRDFERGSPGQNIFVIIGLRKKCTLLKSDKVRFIRPRIAWILAPFASAFSKAIVFHSIGNVFEENLILRIDPKVNVVWISWGYDLYPKIKAVEEYLKTKTRAYYESLSPNRNSNRPIFKDKFRRSFKLQPSEETLVNRIDFIAPVLKSEFALLSSKYKIPESKYIRWNYLNIEEDILSNNPEFKIEGESLLLGHSGSVWLNHIDSLDQLEYLKIPFDELIIPCSYGDQKYISFLKKTLKEYSKVKIRILDDFLPYADYISIIKSCRYLFIDSLRQIGLGNILFFLYYGGIVIISEENPITIWFKEMGFFYSKIGDTDFLKIKGGHDIKGKLLSFWGYDAKLVLTMKFLNSIESK